MTPPNRDAVYEALKGVIDPEIRRSIVELGMLDEFTIADDGTVDVRVLLTVAGCPLKDTITSDTTKAVQAVEGVTAVNVELGTMTPEQRQEMREKLQGPGASRPIPFNEPKWRCHPYPAAGRAAGCRGRPRTRP